jgi:hypothetical protein
MMKLKVAQKPFPWETIGTLWKNWNFSGKLFPQETINQDWSDLSLLTILMRLNLLKIRI